MRSAVPEDPRKILVVDDDDDVRFAMRQFLEAHRFSVFEAQNCVTATAAFERTAPRLVILDLQLPDGTALDLLPRLKQLDAHVPVVIMTGYGTIDLAVRAMKEGAETFLTKPVAMAPLLAVLEDAIAQRSGAGRKAARDRPAAPGTYDPFVGSSPAIAELRDAARLAADVDIPIVIQGETGTGKGVLARWLHDASRRRDEPLLELNCAGLPRDLADAELFGYERGAFTGAVASRAGLLEAAHGGTVLLDELGEMDLLVQAKLLRAVEDRRVRRLGEARDREVDVRLFAATHVDLPALVREGRFREDLYYRLHRLTLRVPPLRERPQDIPVLARAIITFVTAELGRPALELPAEAERFLCGYDWPGNVRELRNVLERAVLHSRGGVVVVSPELFDGLHRAPLVERTGDKQSLRDVERQHIERILRHEGGNVDRAAKRLGVSRSALYHRIKVLGISRTRSAST